MLGEKVRRARKKAGLTQEQLAEMADLHFSYIGQVERGEKNPSLKSLTKIANALGVAVAQLMGEGGQAIQIVPEDVLRREMLALTQGLSEEELRRTVKVIWAMWSKD
jgi:transcriptional regulator with XRE-family HTH domain